MFKYAFISITTNWTVLWWRESTHKIIIFDIMAIVSSLMIGKTFILLNGTIQQRIKLVGLLYVNQPQYNIVFWRKEPKL